MALTGFVFHEHCLASSNEAILAINTFFPSLTGQAISSLSAVTFTAPNSFTLSTTVVAFTSGATIATYVKTITLQACDPAIPLLPITPFDPLIAAGFWSFAMTFVFGVWLLSKNAGAILNFIRRG